MTLGKAKMSRKGRIRVGIIGSGWIAQKGHIAGFKSHEQATVVAVCSRVREKAEEVAREYDIPQVFTDYRDLLALKDVDVITIATPDHLHYPMALDAIAAGKHVICEKPLAMNYAQTREMYEAAEARGLKHMTGFTWRFTPMAMKMRELVEGGFLGRIFHVSSTTLVGFSGYPSGPRTIDRPINGFLFAAGSHLLDLTMSFVGAIRGVLCDAQQHIKEPPVLVNWEGKVREAEVDDSTAFLARFENGAQGIFHTSRLATGRPSGGLMRVEIHGDRGGLIHEMAFGGPGRVLGSTVEEKKLRAVRIPASLSRDLDLDCLDLESVLTHCWANLTGEMVRAIDTDTRPVPSFCEGMKAQEVMEAALQSSRERRWVELPLTA
jgi:predicted dehydrogenase